MKSANKDLITREKNKHFFVAHATGVSSKKKVRRLLLPISLVDFLLFFASYMMINSAASHQLVIFRTLPVKDVKSVSAQKEIKQKTKETKKIKIIREPPKRIEKGLSR